MSQKDFVKNQVIEELLRERANYYLEKDKVQDFWVLISPEFLKKPEIYKQILLTDFYQKRKEQIIDESGSEFYAALISCDPEYIKWIQLRLGYFEDITKYISPNKKLYPSESTYSSDGVFGSFEHQELNSPLASNPDNIHPDIYLEIEAGCLELAYDAKINEMFQY